MQNNIEEIAKELNSGNIEVAEILLYTMLNNNLKDVINKERNEVLNVNK